MEAGREAGRLHLLGLVSHGGVHSSERHLQALIELAHAQQVPDLVLHAFTDGRDSPPTSGAEYVAEAEGWLHAAGGRIGTVMGRYYAMDRDKRTERTELARAAIVDGEAEFHADSGEAAVARGVRARRDRRVHQADARRRRGSDPSRRRGDLLQLPAGPRRGS